ncbi:MFS transporter, partial [Micromonospora sp. DH15]|nr:MFS transporter [Micromonospora sp. DH15]
MNGNDEAPAPPRPLPAARPDRPEDRLALHGGAPVRHTPWPTYDKGAVFVHPEDEEAACRAVRSHLYFRYDHRPQHETECGRFEDELCRFFGTRHALAVSSGTAALALAIMAARVPPGSLVACPGFTFVATPSAIVMAGCQPFLVEVDEDLRMDLDDLRRRWHPGIRAILVVHMRGFAADAEALAAFAAEMGVPLIEDAVPALGAALHQVSFTAVWALAAAAPLLAAALIALVPVPHGEPGTAAPREPGTAAQRKSGGGGGLLLRPALLPGTALALGAAGYAGLAAFVVLHLDARGIGSGVLVLSCFSAVYAGTRLVIGHLPDKLGPRRVAAWSAAGEAVGLTIVALAPNLPVAVAGGVVTGVGFSLLHPSLAL